MNKIQLSYIQVVVRVIIINVVRGVRIIEDRSSVSRTSARPLACIPCLDVIEPPRDFERLTFMGIWKWDLRP